MHLLLKMRSCDPALSPQPIDQSASNSALTPTKQILLTVAIFVALFIASRPIHAQAPSSNCTAATVKGQWLIQNGVVWIPHSLMSIAFVQPPKYQATQPDSDPYKVAYNAMIVNGQVNVAQLQAMQAWYADTIRFQIAQYAIAPNDPRYDSQFTQQFIDTVTAARNLNLCVIISVTDQSTTGQQEVPPEPGPQTVGAWQNLLKLAPKFLNDTGIMFEMFNEPEDSVSTANWNTWNSDMQAVVNAIRGAGAISNILVADGLHWGMDLDGLIPLTDPNSTTQPQIAYAVHPYFHQHAGAPDPAQDQEQSTWEAHWGYLVTNKEAPVIITEWTTIQPTTSNTYYCDSNTPQAVVNLLGYVKAKGIGFTASDYDFNGPVFGSAVYVQQNVYHTTSFNVTGTPCMVGQANGITDYGPGMTVQYWYQHHAVPTSPQ